MHGCKCSHPGCERWINAHRSPRRFAERRCTEHASPESLARKPVAERQDVRQAFVPTTGIVKSGGDGRVSVSLPKEPWKSIGDLARCLVEKATPRE